MSRFFTPFTLNGLTLPNRSVRSAVWEGMADDAGRVTPRLVETMTVLARNRLGLIIAGRGWPARLFTGCVRGWAQIFRF